MMMRVLVVACFVGRAAAVAKCSSVPDVATFCPETEVGAGDDASTRLSELRDNAASIDCAGATCAGGTSGADYATCCKQCTVADYMENQRPGDCANDCETCVDPTDPAYGTAADCQHCFCHSTGGRAKKLRVPLNICHMYTDYSCCIPVFDTEIDEHYGILLDAGDRCVQELVKPKLYLRDVFCMACSPDQPRYVINGTLQICESLAKEIDPEYFDECGMVLVAERGDLCGGDDSILPSDNWGTGDEGIQAFLEDQAGAFPPFLEGFEKITVVPDDQPCYKNPATQVAASLLSVSFATLFAAFTMAR